MTFAKALVPAAFAAALGTAAVAENAFLYQEGDQMVTATEVSINGVNADADGTVVIYDYSTGEYGEMLGMAEVFAGANTDLVIPLEEPVVSDVVAVLYAGEPSTPDMGVAMLEIEIDS